MERVLSSGCEVLCSVKVNLSSELKGEGVKQTGSNSRKGREMRLRQSHTCVQVTHLGHHDAYVGLCGGPIGHLFEVIWGNSPLSSGAL
jgi:hypothetical protein